MPILNMVEISAQNIMILIATAISPAILAFLFHLVIKKSKRWQNLNFWIQQLLIGIFFFALTICSIHFGVKYLPTQELQEQIIGDDAIVKTFGSSLASPVIAGLVFGWPSGLIAGFLGGIYRLVINPFNVIDYVRYAEMFSLFLSGIIAAILRKGLFDNKKPKWGYGFIIGILIETIHMLSIFITGTVSRSVNFAYAVIRQCDVACALVVTFAIVIALLSVSLLEREKIGIHWNDNKISTKVQRWMLGSFIIALFGASLLTYFAVSTQASVDTQQTLENAARDVVIELETSPWGSLHGWKTATKEKYADPECELKPIAYTRRIRMNGYICIVGNDETEYEGDVRDIGLNPIENNVIYSVSADISGYIGKVFTFNKPNSKEKYSATDLLTSTTKINTQLLVEDIPDRLLDHRCSRMTEIAVNDGTGKIYNYAVVVIEAKVTGEKDEVRGIDLSQTATQTFEVMAIMSVYESRMTMGLSLRIAIYIELLIFIAVYGVIYTFIKRAVVNNIQKINHSLEKITEGDLSVKVNVRSNAEFASLSDDINHTVDTLKHYIDEAQKRMEQELVFAKSIQQGTLPYIFPTTINFDLYADMKTAKQVGGDFYDFLPLSNNRLFFLIADVSGKGVPAAMFMMRAETLIKSLVQTDEMSLEQVVAAVNNELCLNNEAQMFVTCWCGILDINTGHVDFVNAGHNAPIVKRKGGKFEEIKVTKNFVLAGLENIPYRLESIDLKPGDEVFIYTDGVTEATDKSKRLYGIERLLKFMNEYTYHTSNEMLKGIMKELDEFQKDVEQADDITMLMIRFKPEE